MPTASEIAAAVAALNNALAYYDADELVEAATAALAAAEKVRRDDLTRPIIGIENRSAQEVFDIMCDRIRRALEPPR